MIATTVTQRIIPPNVPSQVFFGDMEVSGVFPIKEPTMYAIVSLIHMHAMMISGIRGVDMKGMEGKSSRSTIKPQLNEMYSSPNAE